MLDGGFVKKKLSQSLNHFPTVADVVGLTASIMTKSDLPTKELFRIYYYDAPPFLGKVTNPLSGAVRDLSLTQQAKENMSLIDSLEMQPDFAVRRGTLLCSGWELGRAALQRLKHTPQGQPHVITERDLVPSIAQKGVDMRIGLDISWIALRHLAGNLVLVTGDSDFVPVVKLARKEGMRVYLEHMGHATTQLLRAHVDRII